MYNKPQGLFPILQEELKPHGEIGHIIIRVLDGHDCMVVGFTTTCVISAYHH
jgi:hypothetical protein